MENQVTVTLQKRQAQIWDDFRAAGAKVSAAVSAARSWEFFLGWPSVESWCFNGGLMVVNYGG